MAKYIFIHGSWQGGWCWKPLADLLMQMGHQVNCLDLIGHGKNLFPLSQVTYKTYYNFLEKEIQQQSEPIILVAHSMSGI